VVELMLGIEGGTAMRRTLLVLASLLVVGDAVADNAAPACPPGSPPVHVVQLHVQRTSYSRARVTVVTSAPAAIDIRVHDEQVIDPRGDVRWVSTRPDANHVLDFDTWHPRYRITATPACGAAQTQELDIEDVPGPPSPAKTGLDYPRDATFWWNDNNIEIQGAAHDHDNWYIAAGNDDNARVIKIPVTADMNSNQHWKYADHPPFWHGKGGHYGDPDFAYGHLWVPVEHPGQGGGGNADPKVILYDENLVARGLFDVPRFAGATKWADAGCPWIAINPVDGLVYTSLFTIKGDAAYRVRAFSIDRDTSGNIKGLAYHHDVIIENEHHQAWDMHKTQGGAFSPSGHFYVVSDSGSPEGGAPNSRALSAPSFGTGVHGFRLPIGALHSTVRATRFMYYRIQYDASLGAEELEGLDIWDRSDGRSPHISGQIHVAQGHNPNPAPWVKTNVLWFKHYDVPAGASRHWL
jgi:hypothetical protein